MERNNDRTPSFHTHKVEWGKGVPKESKKLLRTRGKISKGGIESKG
jgi:hypothetical protein